MELTASKFRTKDLAYIAVSVALTAICSWISIPTAVRPAGPRSKIRPWSGG